MAHMDAKTGVTKAFDSGQVTTDRVVGQCLRGILTKASGKRAQAAQPARGHRA
jgi:hypothetical protein